MILLSAGHFPEAPGACFQGWCEHSEAMIWVRTIMTHVNPNKVNMVPPGSLRSKVEFVNSHKNCKLALEIHFNSAKIWKDLNADGGVQENEVQNVGSGALTLYCPGSEGGRKYALMFQHPMEMMFGKHWNGVMEGWFRMDPKNPPDYFLAKTNCPALILEPEFIHKKDLLKEKRKALCFELAQVINSIA